MIPLHRIIESSFQERATYVLSRIWPERNKIQIENAVHSAFTRKNFGTQSIVPIMRLAKNEYSAEFWHGPTGTFKDIPAQLLPLLMPRGSLVLTAAAGNAGTANIAGFRNVNGVKLIAFYPLHNISELHRLIFMTENSYNITSVGVDSDLSSMHRKLDKMFADESFIEKLRKSSLNLVSMDSIKMGRVAPLIACLFSVYCEMIMQEEITENEPINLLIPEQHSTLVKAVNISKDLGLPIDKNARKTIRIETENPNFNDEQLLKEYEKKPIKCDAICNIDSMKKFVIMMV